MVLVHKEWLPTQRHHLRSLRWLHIKIVLAMVEEFLRTRLAGYSLAEARQAAEARAMEIHRAWNEKYWDDPSHPVGTAASPALFEWFAKIGFVGIKNFALKRRHGSG